MIAFATKFHPLLASSQHCVLRRLHLIATWKLKQFMVEVLAHNPLYFCRCRDKQHTPSQCVSLLQQVLALYSQKPQWVRETEGVLACKVQSDDLVNHILSFAYQLV